MEANQYFKSYEGYFWQWEEEGSVLAIPDGPTIAYRDFVIAILENLSAQGLPAFGSLLLAMIATNPNGAKVIGEVRKIVDKKLGHGNSIREPLHSAIDFLKMLSGIPELYK